ncbi:Pex19-domain-containing protein [Mollisia scopiformis]|uniref:Pex19-domain-containing protein n=1 Tax=Mollisia scopiformis TaxID=149040 RepID=A0A194WWS9_MOLSC|nr:Pex19-domain-containing protein [Mollisia scopiformis]KUJ12139.1 Pex19-domain-containing protein [Mollisia scopiformis]
MSTTDMEKKADDLEGLAETSGKIMEKEKETASKPTAEAAKSEDVAPTEDIPDPDEDDLDDLDDMLDEFSPSKPEPTPPKAASGAGASGPGRPPAPTTDLLPNDISDEDFAKQFQAGMAELMGEMDTSPDMAAQFENLLKELGGAAALGEAAGLGPAPPIPTSSKEKGPSTKAKAGPSAGTNAAEESFQETIKKTMERMQSSGDQATAAAASENTDDVLAEMMKAMQSGALGGEGGEEEFSKMLLGMMEQLTNKEILYEPMKELDDKFPDWMEKNKDKVAEADLKRYKEQQIYVREIVKRFELKTYKDENAVDREYIVERMQKMQAAGSPPPDLVGDMAAAQEAFGAPEESCPTQ